MNSMTTLWAGTSDYKHDVRLSYHPGRINLRPWTLNLSRLTDYHITIHDLSLADIEQIGNALLAAVAKERSADQFVANESAKSEGVRNFLARHS